MKIKILANTGETTPNGAIVLRGMLMQDWNKLSITDQIAVISLKAAQLAAVTKTVFAGTQRMADVAVQNGEVECQLSTKATGYTIVLPDQGRASDPVDADEEVVGQQPGKQK